jgi:hypothetical protein
MVQGLGVADAAEAASMARSTAYELLQLPEFQDRLRQARAEALATASRSAAGLAAEAVGVLTSLMRSSSSDAVKRLAADSLLNRASRLAADQEVEARIADLLERTFRFSRSNLRLPSGRLSPGVDVATGQGTTLPTWTRVRGAVGQAKGPGQGMDGRSSCGARHVSWRSRSCGWLGRTLSRVPVPAPRSPPAIHPR